MRRTDRRDLPAGTRLPHTGSQRSLPPVGGSPSGLLMRPSERRDIIVNLVRERERIGVETLAQELGTSPETIRRDLTELAARGRIRKFHGGAASAESAVFGSVMEGPFAARMQEQLGEKRAIARAAASLFSPGDALFIDTGTTTAIFAEEVARLGKLTVIANSVSIAQLIMRGSETNHVYLVGGEYRDDATENVGRLAVEQVKHFHAPYAVLTAGAVAPEGVLDFDSSEAEIAVAMAGQARNITILADSSKFLRAGLFQVCPLADVDRLVSDRAPEGALAEALEAAAVEYIAAAPLSTPAGDDPAR